MNEKGKRRRRAVAVIGAAMLVAAAAGVGFGVGRSMDDGGDGATARSSGEGTNQDATELVTPSSTPGRAESTTVPPPPDLGLSDTVDGDTVDGDSVDATASDADDVPEVEADAIPGSGGGGWAAFGDADMQLLVERVTVSGVTVRAHLGPLWDDTGFVHADEFGGPAWTPPGWCFENGQVRIALAGGGSTDVGVIDVGTVSWWSEPYLGRAVSWITLGRVDGQPHRVLFVQAPPGTESVAATFGDGARDTAPVEKGVAILVASGAPPTILHEGESDYPWVEEVADFAVAFSGASGVDTITHEQIVNWDDPEFQASCSPPPPPLPPAGDQPADAVAAEDEIRAAMSTLYGTGDDAVLTDLVDDPTGVAEAREEVANGSFAEAAASATVVIEELVFTRLDEAWFRYRLDTSSGSFGERYGIAVLIDGTWNITRETICQDLSLAGGSCGGDVGGVRPPGYEFPEFEEPASEL